MFLPALMWNLWRNLSKHEDMKAHLPCRMNSFLTNFIDLRERNLTSQDLREEIKNKLKSFPGEQEKVSLSGWMGTPWD